MSAYTRKRKSPHPGDAGVTPPASAAAQALDTRSPALTAASPRTSSSTAKVQRKAATKPAPSVDQRIYKAVFNAVMSQRLPPGTRLGEAEFCELYKVSRTTVRKALQRLAHDHIVELRHHRGAVVASPSPSEAREVFAARIAIEREIVPLVARNATPQALERLRAALAAEHQSLHEGDRPSWIRLGGEFHILLAEVAGNQVLLRFLSELVSRCSLIIALYESPGTPMCENDEHDRLIRLIARGKVQEATALMEQHLREIEERLSLGDPPKKVSLAEALRDL